MKETTEAGSHFIDFLQSISRVYGFHFLCLLWCCVIVVCLAAMKPGGGQQTSLWGGQLRIKI